MPEANLRVGAGSWGKDTPFGGHALRWALPPQSREVPKLGADFYHGRSACDWALATTPNSTTPRGARAGSAWFQDRLRKRLTLSLS
jgi:hypothetical protein